MTKRRSTKSALLTSVLALFLCFTMLLGTTFAWFTDGVKSANNVIKSGNLDIVLEYWDGDSWEDVKDSSDILSGNLWEPGYADVAYLRFKNNGSLSLKYQLGINIVDEIEGVNQAGETFLLSDYIYFDTVEPETFTTYETREAAIEAVTDPAKISAGFAKQGVLDAGSDFLYVTMVVYMPTEVGDVANHDGETIPEIDLGINILATQATAETDGFVDDDPHDENAWMEGMLVYTAADFRAAVAAGGPVTLAANIELNEAIEVPASQTVSYSLRSTATATVIDLNGKNITITAAYSNDNPTASSAIVNNGNLILRGKGTISATNNYSIRNYGTMVIDGVTIENGVMNFSDLTVESGNISNSRKDKHAIYNNNASLTVNGGTFYNGNPGNATIFAYAGEVTINGGEFSIADGTDTLGWTSCLLDAQGNATYAIYDGTINGEIRDYNNNTAVYGGTFTHASVEKFLADGYTCDSVDGTYTVYFPQTSVDSLIKDAQEGDTVEIPAGTYTLPASSLKAGVTLNCAEGTVFEGTSSLNVNGATIIGATFDAGAKNTSVSGSINGTFKNCTFTGASEGLRWCYSGETVVFENCVFEATFRGVHFDGGNNDVIFRNCTLSGFNAFGGLTQLTFEECTFTRGNSSYNGLNLYCNTTLTDCTFVFDGKGGEFVDMEGTGKTLTITNCKATMNGESMDLVEKVGGSKLAQNTLIIDGKEMVTTIEALQAKLDSATADITLIFARDLAGDVTVTQKEGVNVVIDGDNHQYTGTILINGDARSTGEETLTIQNVNFVSEETVDFISAPSKLNNKYNYSHNVTVDHCTFSASAYNEGVVGIKVNSCFDLTVTNCTATNIHSLLQAESCGKTVTVDGGKVVNCKSGVSFNNTKTAVIKNINIESVADGGYGVRVKAENNNYSLSVENCTISAFVPVLVRNATATYSVTVTGTNTMTAANSYGYQVVVCSGDWDNDAAAPTAPTGTVTLTGVDSLEVFNG